MMDRLRISPPYQCPALGRRQGSGRARRRAAGTRRDAEPPRSPARGWREGGEGRGALPAAPGPLFPAVLSGGTVPAAFDGALGVEGCIMYNKAELTK